MTTDELNRLNKANNLDMDMRMIRIAISILRKQPVAYDTIEDKQSIIKRVVSRFIKDSDIADLLSHKLEELEKEFEKI